MISVIVPSRLQAYPAGKEYALWLERAVASVRQQTVYAQADFEIVVGLDPEARLPHPFGGVRAVNAARPSQAHAVNAAAAASRGEILAFLEDDDWWQPRRLEYGLDCLPRCDLVTCNQRELQEDGTPAKIIDYATPSGWLMRRETWERMDGMNEDVRFHVDVEYLGRANALGLRRIHLVEAGAGKRHGLNRIVSFSEVVATEEEEPLVMRTVNPEGGMSRIFREKEARSQSMREFRQMWETHGRCPW